MKRWKRISLDRNGLYSRPWAENRLKTCAWHCITRKSPRRRRHCSATSAHEHPRQSVPRFRPRSPRNGSFVAWLAAVNQYPHPPYGITAIVIPSPPERYKCRCTSLCTVWRAACNNVTSADGVMTAPRFTADAKDHVNVGKLDLWSRSQRSKSAFSTRGPVAVSITFL